ncbi:MAG: DUF6465 family protein [Roseburia sp.]|nr:DUF6465 family protein [Roseburia sp.]MCM1242196.1 DUF6465 family protein [Roseburia sp.]
MAETKKTAVEKTTAKVVAAKADTKKEDVKADTTVTAAKEAPKAAVEAPKAAAKKPAAKKAAAKKTTAKKTTTKKAAKTTTAKTPGRKPAVKVDVQLQFSDQQSYTTEKLVQIAKDVWQYDLQRKPEDFKTVSLYVKPEERKVFYVVNGDVDGSFGI